MYGNRIVLILLVLVGATRMIHEVMHYGHELEDIHEESYHERVDRRKKITVI